jgi:hypothetical protein
MSAGYRPIPRLSLSNGQWGIAAQAGELERDVPEEVRDDKEVAAPHLAWILNEAMQPVQAGPFDPWRAGADSAGVEIKSGTNTEHEARIEPRKVAGHEEFLLRAAEADPENVRLERGDGRDQVILLSGRESVEGRGDSANKARPGKVSGKPVAELGGYAFDSAIKEVGDVGEFGAAKDLEHEIGTGDALHSAVTLETTNPGERCSVGDVEFRGYICLGNLTGAPRFQHAMHTRDTDVAFARFAQEGGNVRERGFHVDGVDVDTENVSEGTKAGLIHDECLSMLAVGWRLDNTMS